MTTQRKKLIEVALPLPEINDASAYDKMPGIDPHPKGIHHWWARLPLPTARAVLFAPVVDDPSAHPEKFPTEEAQNAERERLFNIVRQLMQKRLHEHPEVYAEARREMERYCDGKLPPVLDPFAGGGSIPLEANLLGFEAHAGDLNPVAVLLNKCNLEIAPRWLNQPPVNPQSRRRIGGAESWRGTHGLAEDVRHYGKLIRQRAQELIGHLYPKAQLPRERGGGEADVIAWIWARTVASPDLAARGAQVPLISTYWLCSKGNNKAWLHPVVDRAANTYRFETRTGEPTDTKEVRAGTKTSRGANFRCILSNQPITDDHIKSEGKAGRLGYKLLAIVAEGSRARIYLTANAAHETTAQVEASADAPNEELDDDPRKIKAHNAQVGPLNDVAFGQQRDVLGSQVRHELGPDGSGERLMELLPHLAFKIRVYAWKWRSHVLFVSSNAPSDRVPDSPREKATALVSRRQSLPLPVRVAFSSNVVASDQRLEPVLKMSGAGDSPASLGDPPNERGATTATEPASSLAGNVPPLPSGGSPACSADRPDETGW